MVEPEWHLWRAFAAVLRAGSLSAASRSLGIPQPTLGRQIAGLENALGMKLFTRSRDGLAPTAQAGLLAPQVAAMEAAAGSLLRTTSRGAADGPVRGIVRLTASEMVAACILPPILAELAALHSGLSLELAASDRTEDLLAREADIAVRNVRPTQGALRARLLGSAPVGLFAHRRYVAKRGLPEDAAALARHVVIGWDRDLDAERMPVARGKGLAVDFTIRCSSDPLQWALLCAGAGIGVCQHGVAAGHPDLVRVLPELTIMALPFWIAMHEDLAGDPAIRLVFDQVAEGVRTHLNQTSGVGGQDRGRDQGRQALPSSAPAAPA